jgi:putative transposase
MVSAGPLAPGTYYHVFNRGTNREDVFREPRNYDYFLKLFAQYIEPVAETYAYCLLRNHFHCLVRIRDEEASNDARQTVAAHPASGQFGRLFNAYAKAINKACARSGSLFEHPFRRIAVASDAHFSQLLVYIHRNPQKHGLVQDFRLWPHSSYPALVSTRPTRVQRETVLSWFGGPLGFVQTHGLDAADPGIEPLIEDDCD